MARLRWLQNARTGDAGTEILKPMRMGTSYATALTSATAGIKWLSLYTKSTATSGDSRGIYNRLYLAGAGVSGESLRSFTDVYGVAAATAHGAHISLGLGDATNAGSVTGLGAAVRGTLSLPNVALAANGTYTGLESEIYSNGADSDPAAVTELSFIRCTAGGDSGGIADVDDKAYLLVLDGVTEGAGNMVVASDAAANYVSAARCKINGVEKWLMFASASG